MCIRDRPSWDLTAVLEAVRPEHHYFERSEAGTVLVAASGATRFIPVWVKVAVAMADVYKRQTWVRGWRPYRA